MEDRKIGKVLSSWTWEGHNTVNYNTCFRVEAEITRIYIEGKEILTLRASVWKAAKK